jgi:hypothetical protein
MRSPETQTFHSPSKEELPKTQATLVLGEPFLEQTAPNERHEKGKVLLTYGLQAKSVQEALSFRGKKNKIYPLHISEPLQRERQVISRTRALAQAQREKSSTPNSLEDLPAFLEDQLYEKSIDEKTNKEVLTPVFSEDTLRILFDSRTSSRLPKIRDARFSTRKSPYDESVSRLETQIRLENAVTGQIKDRKEKSQLGEIKNDEERFGLVADHFIDYAQTDKPSNENKKDKKKQLRKLYSMFGLSEFSFEALVGTHGQLVISDFLDNLQFALNLNPTSNDRKALLALAAVTSEKEFPAVHQLVSAITEYDSRPKRSKAKTQQSTPVEEFFASNKRRLDPVKREQIKQGRKQFTDQFANNLKKKRQAHTTDPKLMLEGLLAFHDVEAPKDLENFISQIAQKPLVELQHDEIAVILSAQMEKMTGSQDAVVSDPTRQLIADLTKQLNDHGHYFFNMDFSEHHDKDTYHGVLITLPDGTVHFDLCLIHTPAIDLQLANLSFELSIPSVPTLSVPALSGFPEALSGVVSLGQGLPLFAQAFAFSGASLGTVFSGSERSSITTSGGSTTKPKTPEAPTRKSKPQVIFQSSGGSGSRNTNENGKERNVTPPVMPKPKERIVKTPSLKKPEKPKSVPVPSLSRPKHRETPIFVARSASAPTVSRPITKERKSTPLIISKPKVERVPRIVLQPRIVNQSGNERKASSLTSSGSARKETVSRGATQSTRRVSEVPVATTTASFYKRLEQVFQEKQVAEVRKKQQVKPQSEMRTNVVTAPARRDIQSKPVATAHSVKETKQTPAITSSNKTAEKRTKVEQIKPTETKSQIKKTKVLSPEAEIQVQQIKAKVNIRTQEEVSVAKEVVKQKQVKEVRATQEQSIPTQANKPTAETTNENLVTITAALVGGALFESAKRIIPIQAQETVSPTLATEHTDALLTSDTQLDVVGNLLARRHAEYGQGRGGGSVTKKKTRAKTPVQTTDRVMTASMRSLPTNAMIDVSDSFNTAREVKMWAQEALAHPKLIARYYATAA